MKTLLAMLTLFGLGAASLSALVAQTQPDAAGKKAEKPADKDAEKLQKEIDDALNELGKLTPPPPPPAPPRNGANGIRLLFLNGRLIPNPNANPNPEPARFGIAHRPPTPAFANQMKLPEGQGQIVMLVRPNTPAEKAGIQKGDVLLELNGKPVPANQAQFTQDVRDIKRGIAFDAVVLRNGQKETIKGIVFLDDVPLPPAARPDALPQPAPAPQKKKIPDVF